VSAPAPSTGWPGLAWSSLGCVTFTWADACGVTLFAATNPVVSTIARTASKVFVWINVDPNYIIMVGDKYFEDVVAHTSHHVALDIPVMPTR
jgi:hypothetical protein